MMSWDPERKEYKTDEVRELILAQPLLDRLTGPHPLGLPPTGPTTADSPATSGTHWALFQTRG